MYKYGQSLTKKTRKKTHFFPQFSVFCKTIYMILSTYQRILLQNTLTKTSISLLRITLTTTQSCAWQTQLEALASTTASLLTSAFRKLLA